MNARRVLIVGLALVNLGACATQAPRTDSILEVIDDAENAPPRMQMGCPANAVTFCRLEMGRENCTCADQGLVQDWLNRSFH